MLGVDDLTAICNTPLASRRNYRKNRYRRSEANLSRLFIFRHMRGNSTTSSQQKLDRHHTCIFELTVRLDQSV